MGAWTDNICSRGLIVRRRRGYCVMSKLLFTPTTQEPMPSFLPYPDLLHYSEQGRKGQSALTVLSGKREGTRRKVESVGDERRAGWLLNEKPCRPSQSMVWSLCNVVGWEMSSDLFNKHRTVMCGLFVIPLRHFSSNVLNL